MADTEPHELTMESIAAWYANALESIFARMSECDAKIDDASTPHYERCHWTSYRAGLSFAAHALISQFPPWVSEILEVVERETGGDDERP